jgi:hypothetical protein
MHQVGPVHETPVSSAFVAPLGAVTPGLIDQLLPSHCTAKGKKLELVPSVPTTTQNTAEVHDTEINSTSVAPAGTGIPAVVQVAPFQTWTAAVATLPPSSSTVATQKLEDTHETLSS